MILHHRHIRAVLARAWAPPIDGIIATIWASGTTQTVAHNDVRCDPRPPDLTPVGSTPESDPTANAASPPVARHC